MDVVNVDHDAGPQPRQDFEKQERDISAELEHVGRVDEEHVADVKGLE